MSTVIEPAPVMIYRGRMALVEGGRDLVQVAAITDEAVIAPDGAQHPLAGATILPLGGECFTGPGIPAGAPWRWLGLVIPAEPRRASPVLSGWVLEPGGFAASRSFATSVIDARTSVVAGCTHAETVLAGALVAGAVRRESTGAYYRERQQARREQLVADAHRWADENDVDGSFDDFLNEHGLPGRERDFDLRVSVCTSVYLTQSGSSLQEAKDSVTSTDVLDSLDLTGEELDIEED